MGDKVTGLDGSLVSEYYYITNGEMFVRKYRFPDKDFETSFLVVTVEEDPFCTHDIDLARAVLSCCYWFPGGSEAFRIVKIRCTVTYKFLEDVL